MKISSLDSLPDELLLDILSSFDTARDVARLSSLTPRTRSLVRDIGWKTFVRTKFPSLKIPPTCSEAWDHLADRLTYLDRCWEKRALVTRVYDVKQNSRPQRGAGRQSILFQCTVDVAPLPSDGELLAWGAGEDLIARTRSGCTDTWKVLAGKNHGYWPGTGDVTSLSLIDRGVTPEVLIGRANGDLQLLSAGEQDFGKEAQKIKLLDDDEINCHVPQSLRSSPGQLAISWTEYNPQTKLLASCRSSVVTLYDLSDLDQDELSPIAHHNVWRSEARDEPALFRSFKFLGHDTVACALGGSREPLRWGQIRPTGLELFNLATDQNQLEMMSLKAHESAQGEKTTVRALEVVGGTDNGNLILSTWADGTYR